MSEPETEELSPVQVLFVTRAANEGIPIGALARIVKQPFDVVAAVLRHAHSLGQIGEVPRPDWDHKQGWTARMPTVQRSINLDDVEFHVRQKFKLTPLEAGFMTVLLRHDRADKAKLHTVVENQRAHRALRPDNQEPTDPKIVDVIVCKLRKKLRAAEPPITLQTSWGAGYFFDAAVKQEIFTMIGVSPDVVAPATVC